MFSSVNQQNGIVNNLKTQPSWKEIFVACGSNALKTTELKYMVY